ncbi:valine--tRNA ligase [Candidatus Gottesmanbacteria bacterium]|nr:valine--tRNA ligase [Candidatus Gottesmanbacteria bacterium]
MDKAYDPKSTEERVYRLWEEGGYFTPKIDKTKKPFTILLPLPNANDPMHMGHALFTVQDILVRYHRMKGDPTLWLPGGDHAGIETQYVFEKQLAKQDKSRFDFDRATLYQMIAEFVEKNKTVNRDQMKRLGFSLDWTRYRYSLDPDIVAIILDTFRKLHADGLAYRDERLVNFCTKCGTGFSDLEVKHVEQTDPLYYMKYGPFVLATVRPETKFGDTAVAVHPKDKRYKDWVGKEIEVEGLLGTFTVKVIADELIDPKFGTGVAKVTPAHDHKDFDMGKRHNLDMKRVIGFDGRLTAIAGPYAGMKVKAARTKVAEDLAAKGLMDHIDTKYLHTVGVCYKCGTVLEPLPIPQWYVKAKPLADAAADAVKKKKTVIKPLKRFEKMYFDWLKNILDWNISRQVVWGPRIPIWYCLDCNPSVHLSFIAKNGAKTSGTYQEVKRAHTVEEISSGIQTVMAPIGTTYALDSSACKACGGTDVIQETDTFDTWFLSSQWPMTTLGFPDHEDFTYFYPTSVLDTMWDILFFWVARMMMIGLYRTGNVPFEVIHLHSRVVDAKGQKMSKSKGNVMNPIEMVDKYGADALRFALIFGAAPGSDISISDDKVRGMRNFANKLWNIGRFISMNLDSASKDSGNPLDSRNQTGNEEVPYYDETMHKKLTDPNDKRIISEVNMLAAGVTKDIERYRFSDAAQKLYDFTWHRLADVHVEKNKERFKAGDAQALAVVRHVFFMTLKLLHPFMPFVTEAVYQKIPGWNGIPLIVAPWPSLL